jgi:hypothetical protein
MPVRPEADHQTTGLLSVGADGKTWAVPSSCVVSIEPFDSAESAIDVLALLGVAPAAASQTARVLVLQVAGQRLRLLARGALLLRNPNQRELLPLPTEFGSCSPLVSHVVIVDGKPSLVVVSPERLLHALQAPDGHSSSPPPHLSEARSC